MTKNNNLNLGSTKNISAQTKYLGKLFILVSVTVVITIKESLQSDSRIQFLYKIIKHNLV